jgi:predicted small lipoprotein YifL
LLVQPRFSAARHTLALALLVALALAGCGRIGPLEPPPEATAQAPQAKPAMPKPDALSAESLSPMMKPKIPPITPPNQPFFLDFLLK